MISLVVGLGNPGSKYENTRHNVGFLTVDAFTSELKEKRNWDESWQSRFDGHFLNFKALQKKGFCFWLKPMTYMNLSGRSVVQVCRKYQIKPEEVLIVYDELDFDPGVVRLKFSGGSGGHNGIISIIDELDSEDFWRLRIGIGKPAIDITGSDYVLGEMPGKDKQAALEKSLAALKQLNKLKDPKLAMQWINKREK